MSRLRGGEHGGDRYDVAVAEIAGLVDVPVVELEQGVAASAMGAGAYPEQWFPPIGDSQSWDDAAHFTERELATCLCSGCPVTPACLALSCALGSRGAQGVWGGLGTRDRARLRAAWLRLRAARQVSRSRTAS
jgi:hypothetical protein